MPRGNSSNGTGTSPLLKAARWYAKRGWAVLPLHSPDASGACSCPLGAGCGRNTGKHPRTFRGSLDATTDLTQIEEWWQKWPSANIGIRTGVASGIMVLDIDPRNGGDETLERYIEQFGALPDSPTVSTGGNGRHFYYQFVSGTKSTPLQDGIDLKSEGGYVVAPPSLHASGTAYAWLVLPTNVAIGEAPDWVAKEQRAKHREPFALREPLVEGHRHNDAVKTAGQLRRWGFNQDFIFQVLSDRSNQWYQPPLGSDELNAIAYSSQEWDGSPALVMGHELNDAGNALRFVDQNSQVVRYLTTHGWVVYDDKRWIMRDELNIAQELAKRVVSHISDEIKPDTPQEQADALFKWQKASGNGQHIWTMMRLASSDSHIAANFSDFDRDPWVINVLNGTVNLRSGKLDPHERESYISKVAPVVFDPKAKCPTWLAHLDLVMQGNKELIDYLQRLLGYCLTGVVTESVFPIFWGSGQNGKSTLLRAVRNIMGFEYATTAPPGFLMVKGREEHPTEVAGLAGARLVAASETGRGAKLNVEQMKQLTGEDRLKARYMRMDYFEFPITFKIIYMTNHKPVVANTEIATWRRIKLIPFKAQILPYQRDPLIDEKLRYESSGIFNWLLEGCRWWQRDGMMEPKEVAAATRAYRKDSDSLGEFISEKLSFGEGKKISVTTMHKAYEAWAQNAGLVRTYSKRGLGIVLREREEFRETKITPGDGERFWRGVTLGRNGSGPTK